MLSSIDELWLNADWYAFLSSEAGGVCVKLVGLGIFGLFVRWLGRKVRLHFECHEDGCHEHGKYVIEGGVRCCDSHHPALDERPDDERGHVHRLHLAHLEHLKRRS